MIRKAKSSEIGFIKRFVDSFDEMDVIDETLTEDYYERILKRGFLLVSEEEGKIIGVCFGSYSKEKKSLNLTGLVVKRDFRGKGIGKALVEEFEKNALKKGIKSIELYASLSQANLFKSLGYKRGAKFIAFRKNLG